MIFIISTIFYMIISCVSLKPKFCVNCKFAISNINGYENEYGVNINRDNHNKFMKCVLFPINNLFVECVETKFLVTGISKNDISENNNISKQNFIYCSTARQFNHMCGKEGKMYKKKYVRKQKP